MTPQLYRQFLHTARDISPVLYEHMRHVGPVSIPNRKSIGLARFLARVVIGQQLSTRAARTIWARIEAAARAEGDGIPAFFAASNVPRLRECGVSGNKARALLAIREACLDGRLASARLRRLDSAARRDTLLQLHGIGHWTADMAAMFYFGERDIWPVGDLAVSRTFESYLNARQRRSAERHVARFSPNRSYLAYYMWQILDAVPN